MLLGVTGSCRCPGIFIWQGWLVCEPSTPGLSPSLCS